MIWTLVFKRNGSQFTKSFDSWITMMNFAYGQGGIEIIDFK